MLCGPYSLATATGLPVETFVTRIRYLREQKGQRISLRGGTCSSELREAARMEGWKMRRVFWNRRVPLATLAKRIRKGRWVLRQSGHFFGVKSARHLRQLARRHPNAKVITHAWRVYRRAA